MPPAGPLRSASITPLRRYYGPIRQALAFAALRVSATTAPICGSGIFAFFVVDLGSRQVVHVGVTREPSSTWVAQQMRNATPFGVGPGFIIRDNSHHGMQANRRDPAGRSEGGARASAQSDPVVVVNC
jgi:hypothetical protein